MADNGRSRVLWIVVALLVGFSFGWLVRGPSGGGVPPAPTPSPAPPSPTEAPTVPTPLPTCVPLAVPGEQKVKIGPDIKVAYPDCLTINAIQDSIRWTTDKTGVELWIEFADKPFKNMVKGVHQVNRVKCTGDTCTSGQAWTAYPSDANYDPVTKRWWKLYKYTQVFHKPGPETKDDEVFDGRIIIKW